MNVMDERNLGLISAGVGFYLMLALFPGIGAVIAIWGLFSDPSLVEGQVDLLGRIMPAEGIVLIHDQLQRLSGAEFETLSWATGLSLGFSLWWARSGVASLIRGLNAVYREDHRPNWLHRQIAAIGITLTLVAMMLVALTAFVAVPVVIAAFPLGPLANWGLRLARWAVAGTVLVLMLGIIYRFGPNRRSAKVPWVSPGAFLAVLVWAGGSYLFSVYLANFGRYNEVYGSLGAVIALLMWFYLSALVTLMGAALNAELELRTKVDTTVGPDRPMGERGAYVADTYLKP